MKVYLTEAAATISLSEEEVIRLVEGNPVIGAPDTEFLSPFGKRIVIVQTEAEKTSSIDNPYKKGIEEGAIKLLQKEFGYFKKVVRMSNGEAFRVPTRDIIEKGINEQNIDQYPKWSE